MRQYSAALMVGPVPDVFITPRVRLTVFSTYLVAMSATANLTPPAPAEAILPYVMGLSATTAIMESVQCEEMAKHAELLVAFGGVAIKNMQVNAGGVGNHSAERQLRALKAAGIRCINVSPIREDMADFLAAQWVPIRPTTDTALMLGLAYTLCVEDLYDRDFIARYTVGFDRFIRYLLGETDGVPKDAKWAAAIVDIPAAVIVSLARKWRKSAL